MPSRRAFLAGVGGVAAVGLGVGAAARYRPAIDPWGSPADAWPMAGYDHANTAWNPDASAPDDPSVEWSVNALAATYRTGLVADAGRVYVAGDGVAALDRTDGTVRWEGGGGGPAALRDGTLFVAPGEGLGHGGSQTVRAFDATNGDERWTATSVAEAVAVVHAGDALFVGSESGLSGLDAADGRERWATGGFYEAIPLVHGGRLYATGGRRSGTTAGFRNRRLLDGALGGEPDRRWARDHEGSPVGFGAADGVVVTGYRHTAPGETAAVECLQADSGEVVWRHPAPDDPDAYPVRGGPVALADGRCVAGPSQGGDDALVCRRLEDGDELWRRSVDGHVTDLAVLDDVVLVGTENGIVRAVTLADGADRWRVDVTVGVHAMAAVDGAVFVASAGGQVFALR